MYRAPQQIDAANSSSADKSDAQISPRRSAFMQFFVSIWTRIKFLFTTALAEACECSGPATGSEEETCHLEVKRESVRETDITPVVCHRPVLSPALNLRENVAVIEEYSYNPVPTEESPNKAPFLLLLREKQASLEVYYEGADSFDTNSVAENLDTLPVVESINLLTATTAESPKIVAVAQPTMVSSNLSNLYPVKPPPVVEQAHLVQESSADDDEPVEFEDDFPAESLCGSSEVSSEMEYPPPLTILGRLYTQMENGELTREEHAKLAIDIVQSVLPRNLSDSSETRKPVGANQLYAWQVPPPLPEINGALSDSGSQELCFDKVDPDDSSSFVESILSDAVDVLSSEVDDDEETPSPEESKETTGRSSPPMHHKPQDSLPLPSTTSWESSWEASDISYDGIQTASLDRARSISTGYNAYDLRSKRSSSLKSDRSPTGTPSRKIVRFADSLGLDLATVRQVKDNENPPFIPASALWELKLDIEKSMGSQGAKQYQMCFAQPGSAATFMHRVLNAFVSLENARVDSSRGLLTGTIRVKSVGFEKKVAVRITYNNWGTFFEVPASYVQDSHDGATDRFSFSAVFPTTMVADERAMFAIRYETHTGNVHWDNNFGENYVILCHAKATDMAGDGSWIHYL